MTTKKRKDEREIFELTMDDLDLVCGGMDYPDFYRYREKILNKFVSIGHLDEALQECGKRSCIDDFRDVNEVWDWHKGWG